MTLNRKQVTQLAATFPAILVIYVASSGPALSHAWRHSKPIPGLLAYHWGLPPKQQWAHPQFYEAVCAFYEPMA